MNRAILLPLTLGLSLAPRNATMGILFIGSPTRQRHQRLPEARGGERDAGGVGSVD